MYLKSIEVHGFKSFANKLIFEFHNGITGIVGPNGSGKSNVADAVRWVLGEQSAKQLRGSSMQDVIFSGTEMRKPQSYASVALTISNEDHKLNLPYEEVQVARRVYRSGESEYLLNGVTCRLKDVQELFFDTGIGKEGYSIIGQGQIDRILSGKPEERRELFDEAAGIVKFKKRKATAEKNLEIESQNLLRVQDILAELERQVGPLEEQSRKAREYLNLKEELKRLEIGLFLMDYDSLQKEIEEINTNADNTRKELEAAKEEKEQSKSQYDAVEETIAEFDRSIERNKEKVNQNRLLMTNFESEVRITKEKIAAADQGREYYRERMEALSENRRVTETELTEYKENQKEALETLSAMQKSEQEAQEKLTALEKEIVEKEIQLNEENEAILAAVNDSAQITVEQQKAKSMLEQNSIRKAELNQKILSNKSQVSSATEEMEREEEALKAAKKELDNEYVARKAILAQADGVREDIKKYRQEQQKIQARYHMKSSQLASLKNIAERYDGYGQSIRRVMEQKDKHPGLIGVVADIISVEDKYETAVETALGGNIQNIVTEDEQVAREMIELLKEHHYGRATFLPLTTVTPKRESAFSEEILSEKGVLGNVASHVKRESKYDKVVEYLLGRYLLVDTIENALRISRKNHYSLRIVTLEGELLNPGGSLSGGAFKNNSNLLGRRREMDTLSASIEKIKEELEEQKEKIHQAEKQVEELVQQANAKNEVLKELEVKKNTAAIKYEQAVSVKEQKEKEYLTIANDGQEIENQKTLLEDSLSRIGHKLEESQTREEQAKEMVQKLTQELEASHEEQTQYQDTLAGIRLEISSFQQKNNYISENIQRLENQLAELTSEYNRLTEEQNHSDDAVEEMKQAITGFEQKHEALGKEIETLLTAIEEETGKKEEMMASQKDFFDKRDALMEHINELNKEGFRLDSRKNHLEERLENKVDYMWNEYELTYHNAKEYEIDSTISYTRMKANVGETRTKIRDLGEVNVNAIEDYKSVSERYELLKTQHDDLIESEEALKKIIMDLDEEMRRQFTEKFADIQKQFDKVFRELFGGGKGTLELVEDEDVLEAGITINAQPPGKKLTNMMQLSGGEKALTAIALLFAIQNLKPSPFCLLDEIEAALDDSNVKRYAKYLHKLTKNTQFIVITHRKGTMEAADVLYGITMQEKGVSTLVSVKLIEEQLEP
ncbi:MAG: chromosome segregation protein SMC [Lachnospiraceae bacterium]|nr:chromosome segregation protein SMC [Lachnospiraceae bacterium]